MDAHKHDTSLNWLIDTPTFRALTWVDCSDSQRLAFIMLDRNQSDVSQLRGHQVIIDGAKYLCHDVRTYSPAPYRSGDSVGILVAAPCP